LVKKSQGDIDPIKSLLKQTDLTTNQRRSLAAKILGIHRRYKRDVLVEITTWALETDSSQASKHKVEQWQEMNFGHSVSNNTLADWCDANRGCGERADLSISEETTGQAKELYAIFEPALKVDIEARRLREVSGKILGEALGL
jgi:hypothetical protein